MFGGYPNVLLLLIEEGGLFLELIVAYHPLLLLTTGGFGGGDGALDTVDDPAVFVGIALDIIIGEHREHKLTLELSEEVKESQQVALAEHALIVTTVTTDVGRVDEVEGIGRVVASDYLEGIPIFDRRIAQPL